VGKLLAVFAHPDDETFICGGILARAAHDGEVVLVCATKGEMGRRMGVPPTETRESISTVREKELRQACEALGIRGLHFLGLRDKTLEIQQFERLKEIVSQFVQTEEPSTIVTFHPEWGGHPDHCSIGAATTAAFVDYHLTSPETKLLYVCSGDMIRHPDRYGLECRDFIKYDVSDYLPQKLMAFRAHRTQSEMNPWLWDDDNVSISKLWPDEYLVCWSAVQKAAV
jgi:N-acetylglucosamine malate deacetylase 2